MLGHVNFSADAGPVLARSRATVAAVTVVTAHRRIGLTIAVVGGFDRTRTDTDTDTDAISATLSGYIE